MPFDLGHATVSILATVLVSWPVHIYLGSACRQGCGKKREDNRHGLFHVGRSGNVPRDSAASHRVADFRRLAQHETSSPPAAEPRHVPASPLGGWRMTFGS